MKFDRRTVLLGQLLLGATLMSAGMSAGSALAAVSEGTAAPPLVDAAWLRANLTHQPIVVLEVYDKDSQKAEYARGHIPGALFTGFLDDGWRTVGGAHPFMLPSVDKLAALIGRYGINNDTRVILVPAGRTKGDFKAATRIYWTFRYLGDNNVSILNGGDRAWLAASPNSMDTNTPSVTPAKFVPHVAPGYLATTKDVQAALASHDVQLVDARPVPQFEGKVKPKVDAKAGTLPGAINLPFSTLLTPDGEAMLSKPEIVKVIARAGLQPDAKGIAFCNTGHLASSVWFALREVAENPHVRLYAGSMATWTHLGLPVVAGNATGHAPTKSTD